MTKRIGVFGSKTTTRFLIENLLSLNVPIQAVVTLDAITARKSGLADYVDLKDYCALNNIEIHIAQSYALDSREDRAFFESAALDICFVSGWQAIVPDSVLQSIAIGVFGMHGSALGLPSGRGHSPMNWALIEGRKQFRTSLFKYNSRVDAGPIVDSHEFSITDLDTIETLHFKNSLAMILLIHRNLHRIIEGSAHLQSQEGLTEPTYYPERKPSDSLIDWSQNLMAVDRFIRAVAPPFNGAFTFLNNGPLLRIKNAQVFDFSGFNYESEVAGRVVQVFANGKFLVKCNGGILLVRDFECDVAPGRGDILGNGTSTLRMFKRNKDGNFDLPEGTSDS
ncbi:MAG: hypothetical protein K8S54_21600 [Spirochaetia bacterium]|nr:hypothetical protein [Spirochaetia bacterium]